MYIIFCEQPDDNVGEALFCCHCMRDVRRRAAEGFKSTPFAGFTNKGTKFFIKDHLGLDNIHHLLERCDSNTTINHTSFPSMWAMVKTRSLLAPPPDV